MRLYIYVIFSVVYFTLKLHIHCPMCLRAVRELTELVECPERPDQRYTRLHFRAGTSSFQALR